MKRFPTWSVEKTRLHLCVFNLLGNWREVEISILGPGIYPAVELES